MRMMVSVAILTIVAALAPVTLGGYDLTVLDGIAVMIWFPQALLLPDYPAIRYPGLVVSFIAEVGLGLWLLFKVVHAGPGATGRERVAALPAEGTSA